MISQMLRRTEATDQKVTSLDCKDDVRTEGCEILQFQDIVLPLSLLPS